jgi:hypothetical protein
MSSDIYNCVYCEYSTNIKANFSRHIITRHRDKIDKSCTINHQNDNINIQKDNNLTTCSKCGKKLSSKNSLNKHIIICKGVSNPLECHICHKIFAHRNSKNFHIKKCKVVNAELIEQPTEEVVVDVPSSNQIEIQQPQPQIINNTIVNGNVINNITYNINLISFNKEEEKIEFDISHLDKNELMTKIRNNRPDVSFKYFCEKLFENKNNQMVIKSSLRYKYSNIHMGMNIWQVFLDKYIYPIIMTQIADTMCSFLETSSSRLKELDKYLNIMASNGYSNVDRLEYKNKYKDNIEQLKLLFNTFK